MKFARCLYLSGFFSQDREDILMDVLGKHFSKAQVRCLMKGDWQMGKNWDDKDYKLALTIFTISKRCYHYIRNHHILPLPRYTRYINPAVVRFAGKSPLR